MKKRLPMLAILILLFSTGLVQAQAKFTQRLEWRSDPNALEYKVEVASAEGKSKSEFFTTEKNFISFSKPAGNYRYRVYAYDFLGRESSVSEWRNFEILKAYRPEITVKDSKAEILLVYDENEKLKETKNRIELPLELKNVTKNSEISLLRRDNGKSVKTTLVEKANGVSTLVIEKAEAGQYRLKIKNPGGLEAETGLITIVQKDNLAEIAAIKAEKRRIEEEKVAAEKERIRLAEEEKARIKAEKLEAERMAAEEKARKEAERIAEELRIKEEKRLEAERIAREKKLEEERIAEEKRIEEERIAEEKRLEKERIEEEKRIAREERKNRPAKDIMLLAGAGMDFSLMDNDLSEIFGASNFMSFNAKFMWLPFGTVSSKKGFEIGGKFYTSTNSMAYYQIKSDIFETTLNYVYRKRIFPKSLYLTAKAGVGFMDIINTINYEDSLKGDVQEEFGYVQVQGGLSLMLIPAKHFVVEAGVDAAYHLVTDMPLLTASPYACIGLRF